MQEMEHTAAVHVFDADHPAVLVGADNGPTPVEFLLHALAACLTAGIANIAAARGVNLESVESTVEGDIDLLGILGLGEATSATATRTSRSASSSAATTPRSSQGRRAVDARAPPSTTSSPTACPSRSRSRPADRRLRPDARPATGRPAGHRRACRSATRSPHHAHAPTPSIIGGGQAGLAAQPLPHRRRPSTTSCSSAAASPSAGAASAGTPCGSLTPNWMTRLPGWSLRRPRPRRLHDAPARSPTFLDRLRRVVRRPGRGAHRRSTRVAHRRRPLRRRRPTTATFLARRNVVIATGWCDQPPRPGVAGARCRPAIHQVVPSDLPQPDDLPARRCARRRRVGHRRAARRRARPQRPRRRARRRPPQPHAPPLPRHGHLLVARPDRRLRPHDRRGRRSGRRPRASRRCSSSAAPDHRDVDLPTLQSTRRAPRPAA